MMNILTIIYSVIFILTLFHHFQAQIQFVEAWVALNGPQEHVKIGIFSMINGVRDLLTFHAHILQ